MVLCSSGVGVYLLLTAIYMDLGGVALATGGEASKSTPTTPVSGNVWRSVFHPGSNLATKNLGANLFDRPPQPNSPTVYDWYCSNYIKRPPTPILTLGVTLACLMSRLYSDKTRARSIHR